jgi:hypothetical protein
MGNRHMPIGISGPGFLELTPEALVVKGFEGGGNSCLMALLFFAGFGAIIAASVAVELSGTMRNFIVFGAFSAFLAFVLTRRKGHNEERPLTLRIPWQKIRKIKASNDGQSELEESVETDGEVTILVKKHKPKGLIHFYPDLAPHTLIDALKAAKDARS